MTQYTVNVRTREADGNIAMFRAKEDGSIFAAKNCDAWDKPPTDVALPKDKTWEWVGGRRGWIFDTPTGLLGKDDYYPGDAQSDAVYVGEKPCAVIKDQVELAGNVLTDKGGGLLDVGQVAMVVA